MYKCKYSRLCVKMNIRRMAKRLKREGLVDDNIVFLVMLSGGVWFSSKLFDCMGDIPNEVYYIKGHSYSDKQRGEFQWDIMPDNHISGKDVVVIDDICDSGETLMAVYNHLRTQVKSIMAVTLLKRLPCTNEIDMPVYACIEDKSKDFFVGCGLDDNGRGRLLPYVAIC